MWNPVAGVILAGGRSSRFSGKNKAFFRVGGVPIIERVFRVFRQVFDEIVLVTNDPLLYLAWDCKIVSDLYDIRSSLTGIHAGLFHTGCRHAFFSPCDTPFLVPELVMEIVSRVRPEDDVVLPQTSAGVEPLCAVYARRCIKAIEQKLAARQLKVRKLLDHVRVKRITEAEVRRIDPEALSFFNINKAEDLAAAEAALGHRAGPRESGHPHDP